MSEALFAVNEFTTMPQSFEEDLRLYGQLGVKAVEVGERKLSQDAAKARGQLKAFGEQGFTVTSVQPRVHALFPERMAAEPEPPEQRMACLRETIDLFHDAFPDQTFPLVTIGGAAPEYDFRHAHETARRLYPQLADYAAERHLQIAFEPLHPVLMNVDTFICTLKDTLELIEAVDRPNFGLALDLWHLWQEPNLGERLDAIRDRIFIVHLSDWPGGGPRRLDDRAIPGEGSLDLPGLLGMVRQLGYDRPYVLEILSDPDLPDSLWQGDLGEVIERSRAGFRRAWQEGEG